MRHSLTNRACAVLTPTKLVSWGHVAHISNLFDSQGLECHFFKAYHRAAYKSLPVCPFQTKLAAVVLENPEGGEWYAFTSRTLLFGSIASVLHYNILSRAISELVGKISGIPIVCFFDDFGAVIIKGLPIEELWRFQQFCDICGIDLKAEKTEIGQKVRFVGIMGSFPSHGSGFTLSIRLTDEKATLWTSPIQSILGNGMAPHQVLEGLIGKLGFSHKQCFLANSPGPRCAGYISNYTQNHTGLLFLPRKFLSLNGGWPCFRNFAP